MAREITEHVLREQTAAILRDLVEGESLVVTRKGVPVGELMPARRHGFVSSEAAIALFRTAPEVDYARFRASLDAAASQETTACA